MRLSVNLTPNWRLDTDMNEYRPSEEVDACIIGTGACGGVMAQRLARAGWSVVALEAGPWHDSETKMVSDEAGSRDLYWNDIRVSGGSEPLDYGANNSGRGVGGGTIHYAAFCPRLHPSDFRTRTLDGVGADWPISYGELEPYYEAMEREYPVSGPASYPWGKPHGYPYRPKQAGTAGLKLAEGCYKLGIRVCEGGPIGINAGTQGLRPHCIFRGFCLYGCKVGAKASTMITHVPDAIAHGAEIRTNCMAAEILLDDRGLAGGVRYFMEDEQGNLREEVQRARMVIVGGYAIETPRLLLNSTSARFPNGLANSSGLVGKNLMAQAGQVVVGRYAEMIRQYKAPPACVCTEEFYETDRRNDFARGYALQSVAPLPISMTTIVSEGLEAFGWRLREAMAEYNHYACFGVLGELLPDERNYVTLAEEKDRYGLPVAKTVFNLFENDRRLISAGVQRAIAVHQAAGADQTFSVDRYAHLVGTCRFGFTPQDSVTDRWCRAWDVPNLVIPDGSFMPTQGASNPALTISANSARVADYLIRNARTGALQQRPEPQRTARQ
jgi:choline dehydrogenase-like flavoprotein